MLGRRRSIDKPKFDVPFHMILGFLHALGMGAKGRNLFGNYARVAFEGGLVSTDVEERLPAWNPCGGEWRSVVTVQRFGEPAFHFRYTCRGTRFSFRGGNTDNAAAI